MNLLNASHPVKNISFNTKWLTISHAGYVTMSTKYLITFIENIWLCLLILNKIFLFSKFYTKLNSSSNFNSINIISITFLINLSFQICVFCIFSKNFYTYSSCDIHSCKDKNVYPN